MADPTTSTTPTAIRTVQVALVGNPNTGKSTLFNALVGMRQRVGNYPGVTVERRVGYFETGAVRFAVWDLPGTYSLSPRSPDELLVFEALLGLLPGEPAPDVILCIADASTLERNLYLVSQAIELGKPVILALNMMDLAQRAGWHIDVPALSRRLGIPVVPIQAHKRIGVDELKRVLASELSPPSPQSFVRFPREFDQEVEHLRTELAPVVAGDFASNGAVPDCVVRRVLLDASGLVENALVPRKAPERAKLADSRERLRAKGIRLSAVEPIARYDWIRQILDGVVERRQERESWTDRVDRILTHRLWGTLVLAVVMLTVFVTLFRLAEWPMSWIEGAVASLGDLLAARLPDGTLKSLLVDGVVAGVGAVVVFLPQIMLLFLFIGILEDCGYMARAAFLMDKLMQAVGLSGRSFIPLLSSFACAVPGIMSARVIENHRDRLATILIAPLMTCSARLPVYTILIAAFVPTTTILGGFLPGLVLFSMYVLGIVVAVAVAWILKKTILRGQAPAFIMELPVYKIPSVRVVGTRVLDRSWAFLRRAGTIIFAVSVVIWALGYYPRDKELIGEYRRKVAALQQAAAEAPSGEEAARALDRAAELEAELRARLLERSFLGRMGHAIAPVIRPIGWDWRIGCAVVASFPAREVVISVLGVIYGLGDVDTGESSTTERLIEKLRQARWKDSGEPVFNLPVALSLMVFYALCAQCASTLAVLAREAGHWKWSLFAFLYMTTLAYVGAFVTYRVGMLLL